MEGFGQVEVLYWNWDDSVKCMSNFETKKIHPWCYEITRKLGCRPVVTSIEVNSKINIKDRKILNKEEKGNYQYLVGKLIYLVLNSPVIMCVMNVVGQFMHTLADDYPRGVERTLCYLKNNPRKKIILYTKQDNISIEGYADPD